MSAEYRHTTRVLHVIGRMDRAGAETLLMHVLRNIDREAFQTDIVVHTAEPGAYDDEIRSLGVGVLPCLSPSRPRSYTRNLARIMREHGPYDIVHSHIHHFSGLVLLVAQQAGIPARVVHSHRGCGPKSPASLPRRVYLNLARRLIDRYATAGVAVSASAAEDLFGSGWESDPRWRILRLGIDLAPFESPVSSSAVRAELGIPEDAFVIGHVGRLAPEKNHDLLVRIASEVGRIEPKTWLLMVGDGPLRPDIERSVAAAGLSDRATFAGVRSDTARLMLGAVDVVVHPSFYEGLPLALVEAQAAGVPCVISDVIGPEVDAVSSLVRRLPLSDPPAVWAEAVAAARQPTFRVSWQEALEAVRDGPLNITNSVRDLERFYHEVCGG